VKTVVVPPVDVKLSVKPSPHQIPPRLGALDPLPVIHGTSSNVIPIWSLVNHCWIGGPIHRETLRLTDLVSLRVSRKASVT
jgi:hypothetical protein